jgi:hypothetical protein
MDIVDGWKEFFAGSNETFLQDNTRNKLNVLAETIYLGAYFNDDEFKNINLDKLKKFEREFRLLLEEIRFHYLNRRSQFNLQ